MSVIREESETELKRMEQQQSGDAAQLRRAKAMKDALLHATPYALVICGFSDAGLCVQEWGASAEALFGEGGGMLGRPLQSVLPQSEVLQRLRAGELAAADSNWSTTTALTTSGAELPVHTAFSLATILGKDALVLTARAA